MKRTIALLLLILLLAFILWRQLAESRTATHDEVNVFGYVRNEAGSPISGAEVKALQGNAYDRGAKISTSTTADGSYSLSGLYFTSASPYQIVASVEGYAPASSGLFFLNASRKRIDLTLAGGASLSGHVMDESRRRIPDATVGLAQWAWGTLVGKTETKTDADGAFSFKNLSPNEYALHVSASRYINQSRNGAIASHETQRTQDFLLEYAGEGHISGVVLDENDEPLEASRLKLLNQVSAR